MLAFLGKLCFCLATAGLLTAVSAGSFLVGYHGGYSQALLDEKKRFPNLVPTALPPPGWTEFHAQRWNFPPWLRRASAGNPPPTDP